MQAQGIRSSRREPYPAQSAALRVGGVPWVVGGLPPLRSGCLMGFRTLSEQTSLNSVKTHRIWLTRHPPPPRPVQGPPGGQDGMKGSFWQCPQEIPWKAPGWLGAPPGGAAEAVHRKASGVFQDLLPDEGASPAWILVFLVLVSDPEPQCLWR